MADEVQAADEAAPVPTELTRLFNGGTQPLVSCEDGWSEGVVMPGESILTDRPESYGSPWTEDAEAAAALSALVSAQNARTGDTSETAPDGHTEAQDTPQTPLSDSPPVADGDEPTTTAPEGATGGNA